MLTKRLTLEVKDVNQGLVTARFATLNVVDHDGDVTRPGAFEDGAPVLISAYGHRSWMGQPPVGKGTIHERDGEAILTGQFFLNTPGGRETFDVVKEVADQQEWSYGYDVVQASFGQHEGREVRFLERLKVYEVSPVMVGAGLETATLALKGGDGTSYAEDGERALAACRTFADRSKALAALRAKEGRTLSAANRDRLAELADGMRDVLKAMADLSADTDPGPDAAALRDDIAREEMRLIRSGLTLTPQEA